MLFVEGMAETQNSKNDPPSASQFLEMGHVIGIRLIEFAQRSHSDIAYHIDLLEGFRKETLKYIRKVQEFLQQNQQPGNKVNLCEMVLSFLLVLQAENQKITSTTTEESLRHSASASYDEMKFFVGAFEQMKKNAMADYQCELDGRAASPGDDDQQGGPRTLPPSNVVAQGPLPTTPGPSGQQTLAAPQELAAIAAGSNPQDSQSHLPAQHTPTASQMQSPPPTQPVSADTPPQPTTRTLNWEDRLLLLEQPTSHDSQGKKPAPKCVEVLRETHQQDAASANAAAFASHSASGLQGIPSRESQGHQLGGEGNQPAPMGPSQVASSASQPVPKNKSTQPASTNGNDEFESNTAGKGNQMAMSTPQGPSTGGQKRAAPRKRKSTLPTTNRYSTDGKKESEPIPGSLRKSVILPLQGPTTNSEKGFSPQHERKSTVPATQLTPPAPSLKPSKVNLTPKGEPAQKVKPLLRRPTQQALSAQTTDTTGASQRPLAYPAGPIMQQKQEFQSQRQNTAHSQPIQRSSAQKQYATQNQHTTLFSRPTAMVPSTYQSVFGTSVPQHAQQMEETQQKQMGLSVGVPQLRWSQGYQQQLSVPPNIKTPMIQSEASVDLKNQNVQAPDEGPQSASALASQAQGQQAQKSLAETPKRKLLQLPRTYAPSAQLQSVEEKLGTRPAQHSVAEKTKQHMLQLPRTYGPQRQHPLEEVSKNKQQKIDGLLAPKVREAFINQGLVQPPETQAPQIPQPPI
ncbi:uncharacterized protein BCR38DRAFT_491172 [Pseudomassariella vexata]|uniref:Uncharacterized protein n=1 Tax=Pseudomassariella vexata TaxID=1141098 RepID=A0A1Y2D7L2_9PEZI|nr:uncharacterized protein BCR38DRAFT_491172 [Pseudomassariella vexata]ORY55262.1 hypothetical protein BCR38DRAFT_491172 [Pseudomassariella vexata]